MARDEINYKYLKSNLLNLEYCMHRVTGEVIFKDGTRYTQNEINKLKTITNDKSLDKEKKEEIIKNIHCIKNKFRGTIITDEKIQEIKDK